MNMLPTIERYPIPADLDLFMQEIEREILLEALVTYRFNRTAAGQAMGLSLRQVRYRMARLGITRATFRDLIERRKSVTSSQLFVSADKKLSLTWPEIRV